MREQTTIDHSRAKGRQQALPAGGWILLLTIVGLWITGSQLWRLSVQTPLVPAAVYSVDINRASEVDLLNLPEVGPSLARKILEHRQQHGDFRSLSDVADVPGVGPQTLKQLAPFLDFPPRTDHSNDDDGLLMVTGS